MSTAVHTLRGCRLAVKTSAGSGIDLLEGRPPWNLYTVLQIVSDRLGKPLPSQVLLRIVSSATTEPPHPYPGFHDIFAPRESEAEPHIDLRAIQAAEIAYAGKTAFAAVQRPTVRLFKSHQQLLWNYETPSWTISTGSVICIADVLRCLQAEAFVETSRLRAQRLRACISFLDEDTRT